MGKSIVCSARVGGAEAKGTALLETDEVLFRGGSPARPVKAKVPFAAIRAMRVARGWLVIDHAGGSLELELGEEAATWRARIENPKSVAEKLGVPGGARVALVGVPDEASLAKDLEARGAQAKSGAPRSVVDVVFLGVKAEADLARVATLATKIAPDGALWIVRPKGKDGVPEAAARAAGLGAGLVDVKVVRFSETHTAEKFVVPVARRPEVAARAKR